MAGVPESIWLREQERSLETWVVRDVEYHTKEFESKFHRVNGKSPKVLIREMKYQIWYLRKQKRDETTDKAK